MLISRELAFQIHEVFEALGTGIGLKTACVVGGVDMMTQAIALARKPHVVIATPGRLVDHLENTKGFNLRSVKFLILDEVSQGWRGAGKERVLSRWQLAEVGGGVCICSGGPHAVDGLRGGDQQNPRRHPFGQGAPDLPLLGHHDF